MLTVNIKKRLAWMCRVVPDNGVVDPSNWNPRLKDPDDTGV